jgi:hypothetical protein
MSGTEIFLAATLLAAPMGSPLPAVSNDDWPAFREAVHKLAVDWEILDTRELKYILVKPQDADSDINLLRKRYQELKDAPPLTDCGRLPARAVVNDLIAFNRAFRQHLDGRQVLESDRAAAYRQALQETDRLYLIWDAIRDARCDFYYVTVRRQALKRLRELLGAEAYYCGDLPPYVPIWRFLEIQ